MIDRAHDLPIVRQAKVLNISRGCVYYKPRSTSAENLALMRRMDELHLEYPFAGSRMLRDFLNRAGVEVGRRHVATLMKRMGIEAIYRKPNTSKPTPGNKIYPYLLRGLKVERPNQVWATDITYIPMARGFVYLVAVVDWFSRRVLSHLKAIAEQSSGRVDHDGGGFLRRGAGGSFSETRQAGDIQHRSGQPVHQRGVHRRADRQQDRHQHGWQGRVARQRLRRAHLENRSSTRRFICTPTTASAWRAPRSPNISTFTIANVRIRALTG
jgi:putative transposase